MTEFAPYSDSFHLSRNVSRLRNSCNSNSERQSRSSSEYTSTNHQISYRNIQRVLQERETRQEFRKPQNCTMLFNKQMMLRNELIKDKMKYFNLIDKNRSQSRNLVISDKSQPKTTAHPEVKSRNIQVKQYFTANQGIIEKSQKYLNFSQSNELDTSQLPVEPQMQSQSLMKLKFNSPQITMKALKLYFDTHSQNNRVLVGPNHPSYQSNKALDLQKFSKIYKKTQRETITKEENNKSNQSIQAHSQKAAISTPGLPYLQLNKFGYSKLEEEVQQTMSREKSQQVIAKRNLFAKVAPQATTQRGSEKSKNQQSKRSQNNTVYQFPNFQQAKHTVKQRNILQILLGETPKSKSQ
ncbi:hypothetical protein FGO68_gene7439 [Halteria grandinella]|uniref:Uncharacterized protein n=1 Tax=Halteria grandinella TaxID=5974 RepID=A0A8J8NZP1_HALGN|nr:hypothetical protein FGO68_gene7439 [Halteria grandinella]